MAKILRFPRRARRKDQGARPLFPGLVPGSTDARPARFASDAIAAPDRPRGAPEPDTDLARRLKRRRRSALVALAAVFVIGTIAALFGDRGYFDLKRQQALFLAKQAEVNELQARVQVLRNEVEKLGSEPRAIERIAREDLGFAESGEILLLLPGELDDAPQSGIVPAVSSTR